MEKKIKIKSASLTPLNETLQKLKLNDTIKDFTPVIVEADGKFTSIMNAKEEFNPNDISSTFEIESEENETQKETKEQLLNKAKDALKQTLTNSKELNTILQKIQDLSKEDSFNTWELNKEQNAATLKSKNAQIFKQNNNLCLSHSGKIELFKSVQELRDWLKDNNYPLPGNDIVIHESVEVKEGRNWVDLLNQHNDKKKADITPSDKIAPDLLGQGLGKAIDKKTLQAANRAKPVVNPNRSLLKKETDVEECCGGACVSAAALGPAVAYTATPKKKKSSKKEEELQEAFASLIPGDSAEFEGKRPLVNKFLTWFKRNKDAVISGEIQLPDNFEETFDTIIEPTFMNNSSDSVSKDWNKIILNRLKPFAEKMAATKNFPEDILLQNLITNPNEKICNALSQELNSKLPEGEEYAFGKVQLIPGKPLLSVSKKADDVNNPNYTQRQNWQKAWYQAKVGGATDKSEVMVKTFNDLKNFVKNKQSNSEFTPEELELIKKYNLQSKTEAIFESAKKYPWLDKVLGTRLVEDDSPADFATGSPISSDMGSADTTTSTTNSTTSTTTDTSAAPDIDFGGDTGEANPGFGDINIDAGGYSPDEGNEEVAPVPAAPEYKIIDVLLNDDNNDVKVKVQNQDTKETEIKDLEDIDV